MEVTTRGYAMITTAIRLRYDYDVLRAPPRLLPFDATKKMNMSIFRRSRSYHSRIAVELNTYHNFDHFRHSRTHRSIVVPQSNRNCDIGFTEVE